MKIKQKTKAIGSIIPLNKTVNGKTYTHYVADCGCDEHGKRIRIVRATKADCARAVEEYYEKVSAYGTPMKLTPQQLVDAISAFQMLAEKSCDETLGSIVKGYLDRQTNVVTSIDLLDAYNEYHNSFDSVQEMHLRCVQTRVGKFAMSMPDKKVHDITAKDIMLFLDSLGNIAPKTWNNYKQYISSFFAWCSKKVRRYCVENPIADLEHKTIPYKVPEFASVEATQALFDAIKPLERQKRDMLTTFFALSFFCGMRREEILRLNADDVHLDSGSIFVRMPKGWTKGIPPRNFHVTETATRFLRSVNWEWALRYGISKRFVDDHLTALKNSGVEIPKNAGRHSFITYHIAAYGNPSLTEGIVGTSAKMRTSHYMGLADKKAGEAYFAINA